ncbi:MAG: HAMP domain-containing protein [Spirochaetes bacterium]|jgi:hypothetical protein|nr:HAMP domain-containing protein [Spirochaetota bacterium]
MDLKKKIILIVSFCLFLCIGAFIIISSLFDNIERQLLEKCRIEAHIGAAVMTELMELMIQRNLLTENDIFDTNYVPIPGTRPTKYHTRYDLIFDQFIQKIEDEFLLDPDVVFSILIDKNGYVPTHNTRFSQSETKNYARDINFSRSKRNFADSPAIKTALLYRGEGTVKLYYVRDTGEMMWNIGAPVKVKGKHWGAFLIGVSLQRIEAIKNQMVILIITVMFVILSLTMLAILAVIPRKYFTPEGNGNSTGQFMN